jgi:uncharacterized RDD family membrane protein YckC
MITHHAPRITHHAFRNAFSFPAPFSILCRAIAAKTIAHDSEQIKGIEMNWYYVNAGQSVGPLSDADFETLASTGTIQPGTMVWREGMANWQPYSEIKAAESAPPTLRVAAAETSSIGSATSGVSTAVAEAVCSQCGKIFPSQNLITLGNASVCATCKPIYVQKLLEGVPGSHLAQMDYAGFWIRLLAKFLDGLILGLGAGLVIGVFAAILLPAVAKNKTNNEVYVVILVGVVLVVVLALVFYQIWCLPKYGGTPGKRILGLKVVTAEGGSISWGRAFGRFFAEILNNLIPFYIGYIIAGFDSQKRTVHDHIAGTRVVKG